MGVYAEAWMIPQHLIPIGDPDIWSRYVIPICDPGMWSWNLIPNYDIWSGYPIPNYDTWSGYLILNLGTLSWTSNRIPYPESLIHVLHDREFLSLLLLLLRPWSLRTSSLPRWQLAGRESYYLQLRSWHTTYEEAATAESEISRAIIWQLQLDDWSTRGQVTSGVLHWSTRGQVMSGVLHHKGTASEPVRRATASGVDHQRGERRRSSPIIAIGRRWTWDGQFLSGRFESAALPGTLNAMDLIYIFSDSGS